MVITMLVIAVLWGYAHQIIIFCGGDSLPHLDTVITRLQCVCVLDVTHTIAGFENH